MTWARGSRQRAVSIFPLTLKIPAAGRLVAEEECFQEECARWEGALAGIKGFRHHPHTHPHACTQTHTHIPTCLSRSLSQDSDIIAFGAKVVFFKMDKEGNGEEYRQKLLGACSSMNLTGKRRMHCKQTHHKLKRRR